MNLKKYIKVRKHPSGEEVEEEYSGSPDGGSQIIEYITGTYDYTDVVVDGDSGVSYIPGFVTLQPGDIWLFGGCEVTEEWNDSSAEDFFGAAPCVNPLTDNISLSNNVGPTIPTQTAGLLILVDSSSTNFTATNAPRALYVPDDGDPVVVDIIVAIEWDDDGTAGSLITRAVIVRAT